MRSWAARHSLHSLLLALGLITLVCTRAWAGADAPLRVEPPAGWAPAEVPPPDLSQAPQIELEQWKAWGPPGGASSRLLTACFTTETDTWAPEVEALALDKLGGMASSAAVGILGVGTLSPGPVEHGTDNLATRRLEGTGDADGRLAARVFLGFTASRLRGCYALCTTDDAACASAIDAAVARGPYVLAPPTSIVMRALLSIVHHPKTFGWTAFGLSCLLCIATVGTRKRPRTR